MTGARHSKVGASSAKRWLACPGSVRLIADMQAAGVIGEPETSDEAADGTLVHRILELMLVAGATFAEAAVTAAVEMGRDPPPWARAVVEAALAELGPFLGGACWAERRVVFSEKHDGFGTCDFTAWTPGRLLVADLKTGAGVRVTAEMNPQLLCYALGALDCLSDDRPVDTVELRVIQPRVPGGITRFELTREALLDWRDAVLLPGLAATEAPGAPLRAGEHCRFCPALPHCPSQLAMARTAAAGDPAAVAWVLANAPIIRKYLASVEKLALKSALAGRPPAGYKVVAGKANRQWRDEAAPILAAVYGEEAFAPRELKSPAQIEVLPGGTDLAKEYAFQPQGGPTLVPADDPRPEFVRENVLQQFGIKR